VHLILAVSACHRLALGREIAFDGRKATVLDGDIGAHSRRARSVYDRAATNKKVDAGNVRVPLCGLNFP
jgi:hypothetical protein